MREPDRLGFPKAMDRRRPHVPDGWERRIPCRSCGIVIECDRRHIVQLRPDVWALHCPRCGGTPRVRVGDKDLDVGLPAEAPEPERRATIVRRRTLGGRSIV